MTTNKSSIVSVRLGMAATVACLLLTGCGLAETSAVAASQAASAAEQAKQGKEMEEKVRRDVEAAQQAAAEQRKKAEDAME
jgi:hypothetical protein